MASNTTDVMSRAKALLEQWEQVDTGLSISSLRKDFTLIENTLQMLKELEGYQGSGQNENMLQTGLSLINKLRNNTNDNQLSSSHKSSLLNTMVGMVGNTNNANIKGQLDSHIQDMKNTNQNQGYNMNQNIGNSANYQNQPQQNQTYQNQPQQNQPQQNQLYQNQPQQNQSQQNQLYQNQPYQNQPQQNQSYQNQPQQNQPYQNQPQQNQPYQNQPQQNQSYQNQSYQNQPYQNQPYQNQPYQNRPYQNNNQQL